MTVWMILLLECVATLAIQRFLLWRFETIKDPTADQRTAFMHRLSWVLLAMIVGMLIPVFISKEFFSGILLYFLFAIPAEISQGLMRSRVMNLSLSLKDMLKHTGRMYGFLFSIYVLMYGLFFAPEILGLKSGNLTVAINVGAVIFGLVAIKLLSPRLFSFMHGAKELEDPELLALIHRRLDQAKLPRLRIDIWPMKKMRVANAMVIGMVRAPKVFQGRIILTDSLISEFSREEVDAIVAHEVSHFVQNHLAKRSFIPMLMTIPIIAVIAAAVVFAPKSLPALIVLPSWMLIFAPFLFMAVMLAVFTYVPRKLVRNQELDADWMAVNTFKVNGPLYFDTLNKLMLYAGESTKKKNPLMMLNANAAHPTNEERRRIVLEAKPSDRPPFERMVIRKIAWGCGAFALIIAFMSVGVGIERPKHATDSASVAPASEEVPASPGDVED